MKNKVKHFKVSASFFPNLHLFTLFQNENKKNLLVFSCKKINYLYVLQWDIFLEKKSQKQAKNHKCRKKCSQLSIIIGRCSVICRWEIDFCGISQSIHKFCFVLHRFHTSVSPQKIHENLVMHFFIASQTTLSVKRRSQTWFKNVSKWGFPSDIKKLGLKILQIALALHIRWFVYDNRGFKIKAILTFCKSRLWMKPLTEVLLIVSRSLLPTSSRKFCSLSVIGWLK